MSEKFVFQAEINQLLSLIINSFYKDKEVFLRELLSNASDAIDKYRITTLQSGATPQDGRIRIVPDKTARTLTIQDNGIGMSREDLIQCLGVIANSGTRKFMETLKTGDAALIGQFGMGFYSSFLVADKVTVISRTGAEAAAHVWESNAGGTFEIRESAEGPERGTHIVLHLNESESSYLEEQRLREVVKHHTAFLNYPIYLEVEREVEVEEANADEKAKREVEVETEEAKREEANADEKAKRDANADEEGDVEEVDDDADLKNTPVKPKKTEKRREDEHINNQVPVWTRPAADVTAEEYNAFYKAFTHDWQDPLAHMHFAVEGQLEFKGLLYVPQQPPFDLFQNDKRKNIHLFVRRVFITDDSEPLCPQWLSFVKGLVDSNDLPLNISRETVQNAQHNGVLKTIRKNIIKKSIEMLTKLAEDKPEDYEKFFQAFGKCLKLGVYEEDAQRNKIVPLLRFATARHPEEMRTMAQYKEEMKEGQKSIFYLIGESVDALKQSPFLERLLAKGYDVLLMTEPMDEYMMSRWSEWEELKTINISKVSKELDEALKEGDEDDAEKWKPLCEAIKGELGDAVERVVVSKRLVDTPVALVTEQWGHTANMERIMKAQALSNSAMHMAMRARKIMEINPEHKLIVELEKRRSETSEAKVVKDWIRMLYDTANLHSGFSLDNPSAFVKRIHRLLEVGLCGDEGDEAGEVDGVGEANGVCETGEANEAGDAADENILPSVIETKMEELD
jgi:molecular chaperone HtpG